MGRLLSGVISVVFLGSLFIPIRQGYAQAKISQKEQEYESVLEELAMKHNPTSKTLEGISDEELRKIARKMYEASDDDAIAIISYHHKKEKESVEMAKTANAPLVKPLFIERLLQDEIKEHISPTVYGLVRVAYFIQVKIVGIKTFIPHEEGMPKARMTDIDAVVEKIYKGASRFQVKDTVQFYFFDFWHSRAHEFKIGAEYLVPLEPRNISPGRYDLLALVPYLDEENGYYPIKNNYLQDENNFFNFGTRVSVDDFDRQLRSKIQELKSW